MKSRYQMFIGLIIVILVIIFYWWNLNLKEVVLIDFSRIQADEIKIEDKIIQPLNAIFLPEEEFLRKDYKLVEVIPKINFPDNIEIIFLGKNNLLYETAEKIALRNFQIVRNIENHGQCLIIWLDKSIIPLIAILISITGIFIIAFALSSLVSRL